MSNIFITLIMLHFIGDYYLQFKKLAEFKEKSLWGVIIHSIIYCIPVSVSLLLVEGSSYIMWAGILCGSHFIIDFVKFFIHPRDFSPKSGNEKGEEGKHLLKINIRYFADQFLHILSIALISIWFKQINPDINMNQSILNLFNVDSEKLQMIFKAAAAFIVVLQPVSLTFYKIFDIAVLAEAKPANNEPKTGKNKTSIDIQGAGLIIGFMERIIMLSLLIMDEYTAIGFVIAGKSIIRLNSDVKQEFFIIGTFYGIITTLLTYILFFKI